jgi:hypothetical protein
VCGIALPDKKGAARKKGKDDGKAKKVYEGPQGIVEDTILVLRPMLRFFSQWTWSVSLGAMLCRHKFGVAKAQDL